MTEEFLYIPDEIPGSFWNIIDASNTKPEKLKKILQTMSEKDILHFYWNYEEAVYQIKPFYYELSELSESSIDEICYWYVAQGKKAYTDLWDNSEMIEAPENIYITLRSDPGLVSEVLTVYEDRFKKEIPDKTDDVIFYEIEHQPNNS